MFQLRQNWPLVLFPLIFCIDPFFALGQTNAENQKAEGNLISYQTRIGPISIIISLEDDPTHQNLVPIQDHQAQAETVRRSTRTARSQRIDREAEATAEARARAEARDTVARAAAIEAAKARAGARAATVKPRKAMATARKRRNPRSAKRRKLTRRRTINE